jgi:hypothetical protein
MKILQVAEAEPRFMRPTEALRYSGITRELLEEGITDGHIKSFWLQSHRPNKDKKYPRAIQLIETASLEFFVEHFAELYAERLQHEALLRKQLKELEKCQLL